MQDSGIDVSIIIVNYKTPQLLLECIQSIYQETQGVRFEIVVVDNHSEDNSKELTLAAFPSISWIDAGYNSGFARGNNLGIRNSTGKYVLLMNSDAFVKTDIITSFVSKYNTLDHDHSLGLLSCRIISSVDGSLLIGSGDGFFGLGKIISASPLYIFINRILKRSSEKTYLAHEKHYTNHEVDFVSGACVMIKREKLVEKDLFLDEDFFLYYEDVEWCYRTKQYGFKNYFCADFEVYHVNAGSSKYNERRAFQIEISSYLFLRKRYSSLLYRCCGWLYLFNFSLNAFLLRRKNQTEDLNTNNLYYGIWKKYFPYVFSLYKKAPSSSQQFLKYDS